MKLKYVLESTERSRGTV